MHKEGNKLCVLHYFLLVLFILYSYYHEASPMLGSKITNSTYNLKKLILKAHFPYLLLEALFNFRTTTTNSGT